MNTEEIKNVLEKMSGDDLYFLLQDILQKKRVEYYSESADEYGWATNTAKLAVIRYILCV